MDNKMGNRIHEKRIEKELTMEQLGIICGVQKSAVNKWEKGMVSNMKRSTIALLANALDCNPAWLMGIDDAENDNDISLGYDDAQILNDIHQLTDDNREAVRHYIKMCLQSQKEPK